MALETYDDLKTAIEGWLDNDDLTAHIDDLIDIAEARHQREVRIREMLTRDNIGVVTRYVEIPDDMLEAKNLRILADPIIRLRQVTTEAIDSVRKESAGIPSRFAVHSQIELDCPPIKAYTGEILYYRPVTPLSETNQTNDLLARAPDLYLWSSLASSAPLLMNDERIAVWEGLYEKARKGLNRLDQKTFGTPIASVAGRLP